MSQIVSQQTPIEMKETIENEVDNRVNVYNGEIKLYWEIIYNKNMNVKIDVETGKIINDGTLSLEERKE